MPMQSASSSSPIRLLETVEYALTFAYERRFYTSPSHAPTRFDIVALIEDALIDTIHIFMGNCSIDLATEINAGDCAITLIVERRYDGCQTIFPVGKRLESIIKQTIRDALCVYMGNCVTGLKIDTTVS